MAKVYLAAITGNIGVLSIGQFLGWASPSLPKLMQGTDIKYPVRVTVEEGSWIASLLMLGAAVGSVICACIVNVIGRKNTMLLAAVPSILSWLMIFFATSVWELYISRFISGLCMGLALTTTPMYLGEISPSEIRGYLLAMLTVALSIGTLLHYAIGPFISVKNLALVSLVSPCLFLVTFVWLPESPYHLMRRNAKQKTIDALVQLRSIKDVHKEAETIEQSVNADLANKSSFRELLLIPSNRRAVTVVIGLSILQQTTGMMAVSQYAELIFNETGFILEGKYLTIILGAVQLICVILCMFITDRYGRKLLLIISCIGAACSVAVVAAYFTLQYYHMDTSGFTWLPAVGLLLYQVMYGVGLIPVLPILSGEVYPMNVKALGGMLSLLISTAISFVVVKMYAVLAASVGEYVPLWIFCASGFFGALVAFYYLPETKGKTLEQIQKKFARS